MATNINLIPKSASNLLSGKLQSSLSDSASYFVGDVLPSTSKLPTYLWIDYGTTKAELVKAYDVSGSNVYIKRGINNGGVGFPHDQNAPYYEAITLEHWNTMVDAIQDGWILDHTDIYTFTKVTTTSFQIGGVDRTSYYSTGRKIRFNGVDTTKISSSSYSDGNTTVNVEDAVVPTTISSVELEFIVATNMRADIPVKATGTEINTGTDDTKFATPKAIADSNVVFTTKSQTLTNKTISNPTISDGTLSGTAIQKVTHPVVTLSGTTPTIDCNSGDNFEITLSGNTTFSVANASERQFFIVKVKQGSGTSYTCTWFSGITWITSGGSAPQQTTVSNGITVYGFECTGTNTYNGYLVGTN